MLEINLLDVAIVVILLAFLARGLQRGLTREVSSLVGLVGGFAVARNFQGKFQPMLTQLVGNNDVAGVLSFALIVMAVLAGVTLLAAALRKFMSVTLTSWVDHMLGAAAGFAKGLLLVSVIFFVLQTFFPGLPIVKTAKATPFFNSLADYLRGFLPDGFTFNFPGRL